MPRKLLYVLIYLFVGAAVVSAAYVQDVYPLERAAGFLSWMEFSPTSSSGWSRYFLLTGILSLKPAVTSYPSVKVFH